MTDYSYYAQEWITFLRGTSALVGIPLCVAGAGLVLTGWRIWRLAAICSLALIGAVVGQVLSGATSFSPYLLASGALLFGVAGAALPTQSSTVIGGVIGGTVAAQVLATFGIVGSPQLIGCVMGFAGASAWAFANRQRVVVVITSVEGGILLASGAAVIVSTWPWLHSFFRSITLHSPVMILFFVLVPTVIGMTLQYADANRSSSKAVRG